MNKIFTVIIGIFFCLSSHAETIIVDSADDNLTIVGYENICTLRNAIQSANQDASVGSCVSGNGEDTIVFSVDISDQVIVLKGQQLEINDSLVIKGGDEKKQYISGDFQSRIFTFNKHYTDSKLRSLTLENLFLIRGRDKSALDLDEGEDVHDGSSCAAQSGYGGAICSVVDLHLTNVDLINNAADHIGGGFYSSRNSTVKDSFIGFNHADLAGGFWSNQQTIVRNSVIEYNIAQQFDGGFFSGYSTELVDSIVANNEAERFGGFFTENAQGEGNVIVENSIIEGNKAKYSGALGHVAGQLVITNSTIANNTADNIGAFSSSNLHIENSTISGNSDLHTVGGIRATSQISITHSTIANNISVNGIGGLSVINYHDLSLIANIVSNNQNQDGLSDCVLESVQSFLPLNEVIEYNVISSMESREACNLLSYEQETEEALNYVGIDSGLYDLNDNGCYQKAGLTTRPDDPHAQCVKTHALKENSLAVDLIPEKLVTVLMYDQRNFGFARYGRWDAGAFESGVFRNEVELSDVDYYLHETVRLSDESSVEMYTYFPDKALPKPQNGYPLILAFHGTIELIDIYGEGAHITRREIVDGWRHPVIQRAYQPVILAPQVSNSHWWGDSDEIYEVIYEQILELIDRGIIDKNRIYVTGHSAGGFATWDIARYFHDKGYLNFAAIAPMSSFWSSVSPVPSKAALETLPIWTFDHHSDVTNSMRSFMPILRDYGFSFVHNNKPEINNFNDLKIHTVYEKSTLPCSVDNGFCHQVCDNAVLDPKFYNWIFSRVNQYPMQFIDRVY